MLFARNYSNVCYMANILNWWLNVRWQYIVNIENENTRNSSTVHVI